MNRSAKNLWFLLICALTVSAQNLPAAPALPLETFAPHIRAQLRQAEAAAKAQPNDAAASGRLGMLWQTYEQYEFAAVCYERARRLAPTEMRWPYFFGLTQAALGQQTEAVAAFTETLRLQPDYLPARLQLADALLAVGRLNESQQAYEAALKQQPQLAQALYGLGRIQNAQGKLPAAVAFYRQALAAFPAYGAVHYALGLALRDQGQLAQAQEHLALSQRHKLARPPLPDALQAEIAALNDAGSDHLRRGVRLDAAGQLDAAIAEHLRALELNPQLMQAHVNLISLYSRAGQAARAEQHYQKALALDSQHADLHYNYGVLLVAQDKTAAAVPAFQRALQLNPFHVNAHFNFAVLIEQEGRLDEAAQHYRQALENDPAHRQAHFHLGRILVHQEKLPAATEHLLRTLTPEDDETPRFTYALGAVYLRAGERAKGVQYLRAALQQATARKQTQLAASIERDLKSLEQGQ